MIYQLIAIVQVLLLNGADVNCLDGGRRSALLSACWQGHLHIVDILLTAGADVNQQCDQVAPYLHFVFCLRTVNSANECIQFFLLSIFTTILEVNRLLMITLAIFQMKNWVLKCFYNKTLVYSQGASPLAVSAQEGHIAVLQLMLQHGADPLSQDHHGRDALRVALRLLIS